MPADLSLKRVPDRLVKKLRQRAAANHRSMQGELLTLLEKALEEPKLTIDELFRKSQAMGYRSLGDSAEMIRRDRDARSRR